ncbi:unnamed protein product, partial [Brenthis ino]
MFMAGLGVGVGAGGVLAAEVCAPLLLLCWLCCWPDDDRSDSSSEKYPQKPVITNESTSRRRSHELFGRRMGSSAVSLHLPSTSGNTKQPLSAHRSHEEIRSRRKSQPEPDADVDARYHSAPSVIDEVLHRRDWERSARDLYIPLKSDNEFPNDDASDRSERDDFEEKTNNNTVGRTCKKHYTNIKSSRKKDMNKESLNEDIKDQDVTESVTNFYIGECSTSPNEPTNEVKAEDKVKYKAKEAKQNLNECIRSKDRQRCPLVPLTEFQVAGFEMDEFSDVVLDRSGAMHHSVESRSSLYHTHTIPAPPPSVEAIGYDWEASYLEETGAAGVWRAAGAGALGAGRARHASAGDVLAPVFRPQSGALSESELDFELDDCDEAPPAYHEVLRSALGAGGAGEARDRKETAI